MYACESLLDDLARQLQIDPIDLRLKNAVSEGSVAAYGPKFNAIGFKQCLEAAKKHPNYKAKLGPNEGRGIAAGFWFNAGMQSSAEVHINENGTVTVVEGSPDIGGSRASMALMAAEELGVPYDRVRVQVVAAFEFNRVRPQRARQRQRAARNHDLGTELLRLGVRAGGQFVA